MKLISLERLSYFFEKCKATFALITHTHDISEVNELSDEFNKFSGTVEVTSDLPEKENTVLTINPNAEEVNVYTAEEVDEKIKTLNLYIISTFEELKTLISNNETDAAVALLDNAILDLSTLA